MTVWRKFETAKKNGDYTGPLERKTFEEVANLFRDDRRANNRRISTLWVEPTLYNLLQEDQFLGHGRMQCQRFIEISLGQPCFHRDRRCL